MGQNCVVCKSPVTIPICDDLRAYEYPSAWTGSILACESCGLIQQSPMLTVEEALELYPESYTHYNPQASGMGKLLMRLYMQRTVSFFKKMGIGSGSRVLDIGCGAGEKIAILSSALGFEAVGVEPNPYAAANAQKSFNLKVYTGTFPLPEIKEESFDAVYINHVIEHVPDPVRLLNDIYLTLKPGGLVIGETENVDCPSFRFFGRYWALLHLPFHLLFFTRDTLSKTFSVSKFSEVNLETLTEPTVWSLSLQNYLRRNRSLLEPRGSRMPGYLPLTLLSVGFSWIEKGRGPIIRFWAQKP